MEHLDEEGWGTPKTIASDHRMHDLGADELTIERRLYVLAEREMVAPIEPGFRGDEFEITSWGQAYLRGDLDAAYLPRHNVAESSKPLY
ncbi:MAG: hypothetical protein ABEH78_02190 [Haloferacaceae archaeon]